MAGRIHFSSGKTLDINDYEFRNMPVDLNSKGIKVKRLKSGHLIPMNSMTMEYVEFLPEEVEEEPKEMGENAMGSIKARTPKEEEPTVYVGKDVSNPTVYVEKPKRKTDEEIMAEMMAKSNCTHPPEKLELFIQHTAKGIRYFPVCSFCGKRERYVSENKIVKGEYAGTPNEKWTEEDVANAQPWIDK